FAFFSLPLYASLVIWPTNLVLENNQKNTVLWLENRGKIPQSLQVRIYEWQQQNNEPILNNQQQVMASPPMMTIEPGKKQMIRILNPQPAASGKESFYRLIIDEVATNTNATPTGGVSFQLRYSIPLFIYGAGL